MRIPDSDNLLHAKLLPPRPRPPLPLLILILSFAGRLPKGDRWWCALLLVLATLQPVVLYLRGVQPLLGALHPVNAMLLFVLPLFLLARVFSTAGTFQLYCTIHPKMNLTVTVQ